MLLRVLADACFLRGAALLDQGSPRKAQALLALATRLSPANPHFLHFAAKAASALGERDKVARFCERALSLDPLFLPAHELLTSNFLHGDPYVLALERIHLLLKPRVYVEIGVDAGGSMRVVAPETLCFGVDPAPVVSMALPPNVRIFAQTSDDFFARSDLPALFGGPIELAFIDGMHHFEFALRDFMNLERLSAPGATILIHDCFPHNRLTAGRERQTMFWSGDIWRLVVLLKKYRPDLRIHTIATPPTGLGIVRNLNPASRFIADNLQRLYDEFLALDYSFLEKDRAGKLSLFPNDWGRIRALLDSSARNLTARSQCE